jgi:hypothetical protein
VRRALRWLGIAVGVLAVALGAVLALGRLHDGPLGPITGGPFRSGEVAEAPGDWSFAKDAGTLELELPPAEGRSITTWLVVVDGRLYLPSAFAESKRWPALVAKDGRVRVRLAGRIYPLGATKLDDPTTQKRVAAAVGEKYHVPSDGFGTRDWLFALSARAP